MCHLLHAVHAELLSLCPTLCDLWTVAHEAAPSLGFPRQEYWSGWPFPSPGDLLDPGIEPAPLMSLALASGVLYHWCHLGSYYISVTPKQGCYRSFPGGSEAKEYACNAEDLGSIPGSGRSPGEGNGYTLHS